MRGIRNQNFLARISLVLQIRANHQEAGQFALRARGRLQSGGVHAGDREQALLQIVKNPQAALRKFRGLFGMLGREPIEPRDEFVHARVVLHSAGAERIHPQIDGVIPGGKPREVADDFDFADFREAVNRLAREFAAHRRGRIDRRNVERRQLHPALARRGFLEDQPFVLADVLARLANGSGKRFRFGGLGVQCRMLLKPVVRVFFSPPRPAAQFRSAAWSP